MKRLLTVILALLMIASLGTSAFADSTTTQADLTGHTYTAYQIFSGTQAEDSDELGNIEWGSGIDSDAFLTALQADATVGTAFTGCITAADVADVMSTWTNDSAEAKAFARIANDNVQGTGEEVEDGDELDAGYYLIVDTTDDADTVNLSLLQLTNKGEFEIRNKTEVPQVEKKVSDDNNGLICTDTTAGHEHNADCYSWANSNQVAIGDTVHFKIESAVPEAASDYDYYYFIIGDTLSDGLTFTTGSIAVTIGDDAAAANTDYSVQFGTNDRTFEIALIDAKSHAGEKVVVTYDAVLNSDAVVGTSGNNNEVNVEYSSNPNVNYDGTDDNDHPGFPASNTDVPTGVTPNDYTITYTTQVKVFKVDNKGNPLQGAEFTLTGESLNKVLVYTEEFTQDADGTYYKLKNGTYTETAPVTADYMAAAAVGAQAGYVEAENGYDGDDKVTVGGVDYRPYVPADDAGKDLFVLVKANTDLYDSTTTKYKMTRTFEEKTAGTTTHSVVGEVDDNGEVIFTGLSAGDYTLSETQIPDGYNPIDDIEFTINWTAPSTVTTGTETCTWSVESDSDIAYVAADNAFEITIVNQKGNTLPETGGIGTTLFYVFGGILVAAAVVILIAKKRMDRET